MTDCAECCDPIVFAILNTGRRIPLNPLPDPRGNVAVRKIGANLHGYVLTKDTTPDPLFLRMMPHFATCEARRNRETAPPADAPLF